MEQTKIKYLIHTKNLSIKYIRNLGIIFLLLKISNYKSLSFKTAIFHNDFNQGTFAIGFDFCYRLKNVDHLGFDMSLNFIFFTIELNFSDYRHVEDYGKND